MAQIEGIGGVFCESEDAARLATWYEQVLGIEMTANPDGSGYYTIFPTRDRESGVLRANPVFAINQAQEALAEAGRGFMVNFRVDDLDGFLEMLGEKGIEIEERRIEWEGGRHAWICDPESNRIELYEEILFAGLEPAE
jgi:predicted enzyme related to lactoylglutathione lyase